MSGFARIVARKGQDRGRRRREIARFKHAKNAALEAAREHTAKIEPIAPAGVSQPGARRKAS